MIKAENEKVRFAIVGCGHIGKRHAEMVLRNDEATLVAMCDIKPANELDVEKYNVPFFSSVEEMLASDLEFDVVNICTPNGLHAGQSIQALEAHSRHESSSRWR